MIQRVPVKPATKDETEVKLSGLREQDRGCALLSSVKNYSSSENKFKYIPIISMNQSWQSQVCHIVQQTGLILILLMSPWIQSSLHHLTSRLDHSLIHPAEYVIIRPLLLPSGDSVELQVDSLTSNRIALICLVRRQLTALSHVLSNDLKGPTNSSIWCFICRVQ